MVAHGPNKRRDTLPVEFRVIVQAGLNTKEAVCFREGEKVTLQIEERLGGAEITLGVNHLALLLVHLQRLYDEAMGAGE